MSNENQGGTNIPQALASTFPSGFQAIATAYGDYTKKSFDETKSYVEKMSGAKSFENAIEIQTEFAKTAYETFVSESQKIAAMYVDLGKQSCKPFVGFVAKATPTGQ
jgi:phasin family protein